MKQKARSCLIQPVDRDYRLHGGGRQVHFEFLDEPVSYAIRTSVIPLIAIENESNIGEITSEATA